MKQDSTTMTFEANTNSKPNEKALKIATVIASVLAICGVGFGAFSVIQNSQKDNQISDLKVQVEDANGKITTLNTKKIETSSDKGTTVTIADPTNMKYVFSEKNAKKLNKKDSMTVSSVSYAGIRFFLHLDGAVDATYQWVDWGPYKSLERETDSLTDHIGGRVVDIVTGHIGNGSSGEVFFLLEDGTVAYISEENILAKKFNFRKMSGANDVARIYGSIYDENRAGFVQFTSGEISPIVLDKFEGDDTILRVE